MKLESIKIEKELEKQRDEEKHLNMLINDKVNSALAGMCYRFSKKSPWYIITEFIKPRDISKTYVYSFLF